jgi:hypothetical protein
MGSLATVGMSALLEGLPHLRFKNHPLTTPALRLAMIAHLFFFPLMHSCPHNCTKLVQ